MDELFNNREIAAAIWLFALLVLGVYWKVTRKGLVDILKAFFTPNLFLPMAASFLPVVLIVVLLAYFDLWDLSVLKESIYWLIGTGLVMFSGFTKVQSIGGLLKKTAKETLAIIIILEFFVGFYVFPLWVELMLLPFTTFIILMATVARYQKVEGIELTRKVLDGVITVIGLAVLFSAVVEFAHDSKSLFTYENLELFLLPIILSFAYMPSVYAIALYGKYELVFNRINFFMDKNIKGKFTIKIACIKRCKLSVYTTSEMIHYLAMNLTMETTKAQALKLIEDFDPKKSFVDLY